jgi:hypothetical protein
MTEEHSYPAKMYWNYVWRQRSKAKLYSLNRAVPSIVIAIVQSLLRKNRSFAELVLIVATIFGVYLGLFVLESLWKFVVDTPVKIYAEQIDLIAESGSKFSFLERRCAELEAQRSNQNVSPQEQRRRELVSSSVTKLNEEEKKILRYVFDQGRIDANALKMSHQFDEASVQSFVAKALPGGLILYQNHVISIKPELAAAVEFVLFSQ